MQELERAGLVLSSSLHPDPIRRTKKSYLTVNAQNAFGMTTKNASDASSILVYAAECGVSGFSDYLDDAQKSAADADGDGSINADDASYVLQYAAMMGLGETISMQEFMQSRMLS